MTELLVLDLVDKQLVTDQIVMDAAPLLKAQGLDETYKLLADFNGVAYLL